MNHDGLSLGRSTRTPQLQDVPKTLTGFPEYIECLLKRTLRYRYWTLQGRAVG